MGRITNNILAFAAEVERIQSEKRQDQRLQTYRPPTLAETNYLPELSDVNLSAPGTSHSGFPANSLHAPSTNSLTGGGNSLPSSGYSGLSGADPSNQYNMGSQQQSWHDASTNPQPSYFQEQGPTQGSAFSYPAPPVPLHNQTDFYEENTGVYQANTWDNPPSAPAYGPENHHHSAPIGPTFQSSGVQGFNNYGDPPTYTQYGHNSTHVDQNGWTHPHPLQGDCPSDCPGRGSTGPYAQQPHGQYGRAPSCDQGQVQPASQNDTTAQFPFLENPIFKSN